MTAGALAGVRARLRPARPAPLGRDLGAAGGWGRLPFLLALTALGALLVATAYAGGRAEAWWGDPAYWLGEILMFAPIAYGLLSRGLAGGREALGLVLGLAVATSIVRYAYSPLEFKFPDELQHWRSMQDVLDTGHLFAANPSLPISPRYPGLEIATGAVVSLTGLPVFAAGLIVVGIAHALTAAALFLIFRLVGGSARLAGIAAAVSATGPHFQSFDAMFVYQVPALSLTLLAVLATVRLTREPRGEGRMWWAIAALAVAATTVTHHATAMALLASLALVAGAHLLRLPGRARDPRPLALLGAGAGVLVAWIAFVAPETVGYLGPSAERALSDFTGFLSGGGGPGPQASPGLPAERVLAAAAMLAMAVALPFGWMRIWRARRGEPWAVALAAGAVGFYVTLGLRLFSAEGAELAGRALTFVLVPVGFVIAAAASGPLRRTARRGVVTAAGVALALVLFVGGLASGYPPHWGRLPGPLLVDAFERGVGPEGLASARWTLDLLGPENRIGADSTNHNLVSTHGRQVGVRSSAPIYYAPAFRAADRRRVRESAIRYLVVDRRLSEQLPATGKYFNVDPLTNRHTRPVPAAALSKFDGIAGVSRLYDGGAIAIYDLEGSRYAPY